MIEPAQLTPPNEEYQIFEIRPSWLANFGLLFWGIALLPVVGLGLLLLARAWYLVHARRYRLSSQRLFMRTGLIANRLEEIELFRVKDVILEQGVLDRLLGIGNVQVLSTDDTMPRLVVRGIRNPEQVKEQIRGAYRAARQQAGMRTTEFIMS